MPSRQTLAELTLDWCASEVLPPGAAWRPRKAEAWEAERMALARTSRDAARAAGVALLQAAAAELDTRDSAVLGQIAAVIENDAATANLEERLLYHGQEAGSPRERAAFVGNQFKQWMEEQLGDAGIPLKVHGWLQRGWPDARVRGGVMTFYRAFCGALQRAVRQDQKTWDDLMKNTGVDASTWRQWLIRESNSGTNVAAGSKAKTAVRAFVAVVILAAAGGSAAWFWWNKINARLQAPDTESVADANTTESPSPPSETTAPVPPPTPAPRKPLEIAPKTSAPNLRDSPEELPRVIIRPDPLEEATRLINVAERTLDSDNSEEGDVSARSAQDILSARTPSNDVPLAELLIRLAQYWEQRDDWAEAARLYQRAVKAFERTPAENANPQLQAVDRWAAALRHSGRNTEAERLYRMLLQAYEGMGSDLRPEMASVAHNLGNVLLATGRIRDARECYEKALTLLADRQSESRVEPLLGRFKDSYEQCLRKLGVSDTQIEADLRQILGPKPSPKRPPAR
jgi:tetratricopeptide (TPR) repeat protein